jgi:hypothetical protein
MENIKELAKKAASAEIKIDDLMKTNLKAFTFNKLPTPPSFTSSSAAASQQFTQQDQPLQQTQPQTQLQTALQPHQMHSLAMQKQAEIALSQTASQFYQATASMDTAQSC